MSLRLERGPHALMADFHALRPQGVRDGPERPPLPPQRDNLANGLLVGVYRDELTALAAPVAERQAS